MKHSRLLSILLSLQTKGRMSSAALAAEFEVTPRTIHRDIDQLSAAGVPVYAERGRSGGFRLRDGYRTNLTGLTQPEAEAIFLAGLPGPAAQLGLADILATARLKLMAALPAHVQPGAERISARFHLDAATWFRGQDALPSLQLIARAVWGERVLALRYPRRDEVNPPLRSVHPLGLVLKGGVWYLVARGGKLVRTYRVAHMEDVAIAEETFSRPKDFDLAAHWEKAAKEYESGLFHASAEITLSPQGMRLLGRLGAHVVDGAARTAGKPDRKGWVRCTIPIESNEDGVREMMRLGREVTVLGPPALLAEFVAAVRVLASAYSPGTRA